jgi:hypothetical protein
MVEIHIDEIPDNTLLIKINYECRFGGNLSVHKGKEERMLLSFGQDECIFHQFIFTGSAWTGPKGEQGIFPKEKDNGLMLSTFQCRKFGFGMTLTPEELEKGNKFQTEKKATIHRG